jgi:hypothetical protein
MTFSGEINDRKERKKVEKMKSKQILVPNKQNVRRWRYRSGYTYLQRSWLFRLSFCGPDGQRSSMEGSKTVGSSH